MFKWILYMYVVFSAIAAYTAYTVNGLALSLALFAASMMAWWAGSGFRGSMLVGNTGQKLGGTILGALFLGGAIYVARYFEFSVFIAASKFTGTEWCILGMVIGILATSRKDASSGEKVSQS